MRLQCLCILLFLLTPAIIGISCAAAEHESPMSSDMLERSVRATNLTTCEPILIENDLDFILQGWPGSGIENDPFRLEGLAITSDGVCVSISNTTVHFLISSCLFQSSSSPGIASGSHGMSLTNLTNARIMNCTFAALDVGLALLSCDNSTIDGCMLECGYGGIWAAFSSGVDIVHCLVSGSQYGVSLINSGACRLASSLIQECLIAAGIHHSGECTIESNTIARNLLGLDLGGATTGSIVRYNIVVLNSGGVLIDDESCNNALYGNTIARNAEHNAHDNGQSNKWDDGTAIGNTWGDYLGFTTYLIPGDAGSVDNYPLTYPPTIQMLVVAVSGVILIVSTAFLLVLKGRSNPAVCILSFASILLLFVIPPVEGIEQSLPVTDSVLLVLNVVLLALASWSLGISRFFLAESVGIVDQSSAVVSVVSFALISLNSGMTTIPPFLTSTGSVVFVLAMVILAALVIIVQTSRSSKRSIRETSGWYFQLLNKRVSGSLVKEMPKSYDPMESKLYYFEVSLVLLLGPGFGFFLGLFGFVLDEAGVLSVSIFAALVAKELYGHFKQRAITLPVDDETLLAGFKHGMILPNGATVLALFASFVFFNALLTASRFSTLWVLLWSANTLTLIVSSLANLYQGRSITDWDTFIHRGSSAAVVSLGCMYGIAYLFFDWRNLVPFFDSYMELPTPILVLWIVMLVITAALSMRRVETSYTRFVLRPAVFLFYSLIPVVYFWVIYANPFLVPALLALPAFFGLSSLALRASYPMKEVLLFMGLSVFYFTLPLWGLELILILLLFIFSIFLVVVLVYEGSWHQIGPQVMNDPESKAALITFLEGPLSLNLFAEKAGLEVNRAKEILGALRVSGVMIVIGRGSKVQFEISSGYYRKRIAAAKQGQPN